MGIAFSLRSAYYLGAFLTPDQVRQAHRIFDDLPEQERSFTVDTLHVYAYDGADWEPLGALSLKP